MDMAEETTGIERAGMTRPLRNLSNGKENGMVEVCEYPIEGGTRHREVNQGGASQVDQARAEAGTKLLVLSGSRRSFQISRMGRQWL